MTAPAMLSRLLPALAIVAAALWLAFNRERLDPAAFETAIRGLGWWAPFAHVALFAIGTVLFVPGTLFGLAGGVLFGPVSFVGRVGSEILMGLQGVAASTGAACHSGLVELSPVLRAMGVAPEIGMGAIRFSLGRGTTEEEIDAIVAQLRRTVATQGS